VSVPLGSPWRRFWAYTFDYSLVGAILISPFLILISLVAKDGDHLKFAPFIALIWAALLFVVVVFGYLDGATLGTPGKRLLGLEVVDVQSGGPIGVRRGILRELIILFSGLLAHIPQAWMLWDKRRQGLQDKAAKSIVIDARNKAGTAARTSPP
jgi:uncharacterized RDD family membrane protein YckC